MSLTISDARLGRREATERDPSATWTMIGMPQGGPGAGAGGDVPVLGEAHRDARVVDDQPGRVVFQNGSKVVALSCVVVAPIVAAPVGLVEPGDGQVERSHVGCGRVDRLADWQCQAMDRQGIRAGGASRSTSMSPSNCGAYSPLTVHRPVPSDRRIVSRGPATVSDAT